MENKNKYLESFAQKMIRYRLENLVKIALVERKSNQTLMIVINQYLNI
jgi:hypothetical protein